MTRSLSNAKILSVIVVAEEFSNAIFRRGFAVAAKTASQERTASAAVVLKNKVVGESRQEASWIPDPKTGYYRPETVSEEIDPAELRALLLNNKQ